MAVARTLVQVRMIAVAISSKSTAVQRDRFSERKGAKFTFSFFHIETIIKRNHSTLYSKEKR